jgi:hypothetical protein
MGVFVLAQDEPSVPGGVEDAEKIQGAIDEYSPFDESGDVNFSSYKPFKTKAEERIDAINLWLEENAAWLKVLFGMVPSISWVFAFNVYLLLFFFVNLVLHGNVFDLAISSKKFDLIFFEATWGHMLGLAIFLIMDLTKIIANLATFGYKSWVIIWNWILPAGVWLAVIVAIAAGIGFIFLLIFVPKVLSAIYKKIEDRKKKAAAEEEAVNRKALGNIVNRATAS